MKRIPELRDLSDDHHTALVLARRCQREPEDAWPEVRAAFGDQLEPHFRIEEEHLLPALDAIGEGALAARIREDHARLRALARREAPDPASVAAFGARLEAHVRFEERQVFEPTQHRLPAPALRALAAACRTRSRVCPAAPGA